MVDPFELFKRAVDLRNAATRLDHVAWMTGFIRGVQRIRLGHTYGTYADHLEWLTFVDVDDRWYAAAGRGYLAGLDLNEDALERVALERSDAA